MVNIKRRHLWFLLKFVISSVLIAILLFKSHLSNLRYNLISVDLFWLIIMFLVPHISIFISTIKWKILLEAISVRESVGKLFSVYLVGTFFNNFLPGMIGGDIYRIMHLSTNHKKGSSLITAATFMERFTGLTALISLFILTLLNRKIHDIYPLIGIFGAAVLTGYFVLLFLILQNNTHKFLSRFKKISYLRPFVRYIESSHCQVRQYKNFQRVILSSYLLSLCFYLLAIFTVFAATLSVGVSIDIYAVATVVPLVLLVGMVPISLNGLGVNECSYVFFFSLFGIQSAESLSIAILLRARILFTGLLGGLVFSFQQGAHSLPHEVKRKLSE